MKLNPVKALEATKPQHEDDRVTKLEAIEPLVSSPAEQENVNQTTEDQTKHSSGETSDAVAIDKVRELLFGETIRAQKDELLTNHRKILQRVEALHKVTGKRIDALSKNLELIRKSLAQETKTREGCMSKLTTDLSQTEDMLSKDVKSMHDTITTAEAGMREELEKGVTDYTTALVETEDKLIRRINEQFDNLKDEKVSSGSLAGVLRNMAETLEEADNE